MLMFLLMTGAALFMLIRHDAPYRPDGTDGDGAVPVRLRLGQSRARRISVDQLPLEPQSFEVLGGLSLPDLEDLSRRLAPSLLVQRDGQPEGDLGDPPGARPLRDRVMMTLVRLVHGVRFAVVAEHLGTSEAAALVEFNEVVRAIIRTLAPSETVWPDAAERRALMGTLGDNRAVLVVDGVSQRVQVCLEPGISSYRMVRHLFVLDHRGTVRGHACWPGRQTDRKLYNLTLRDRDDLLTPGEFLMADRAYAGPGLVLIVGDEHPGLLRARTVIENINTTLPQRYLVLRKMWEGDVDMARVVYRAALLLHLYSERRGATGL